MLKMVSKKSMLLLGVVMALCAFVLPSVASAASWSPVGTTDGRIDSNTLGFSIPALEFRVVLYRFDVQRLRSTVLRWRLSPAPISLNCHGDIGGLRWLYSDFVGH